MSNYPRMYMMGKIRKNSDVGNEGLQGCSVTTINSSYTEPSFEVLNHFNITEI